MAVIETQSLTKTFGHNRGVIDVNLKVAEGEFFGFIGPNGAGKSTTIRLLLNFIYPTGGGARIFGLDCEKESEKIKAMVGYLPNKVNYYKEMRVSELLDYAVSFHRNTDKARYNRLVERFEPEMKKRIGALSLGNRKKVAIVQALLHRPNLLILDEPTNGLDPLMQQRLFETLAEENKNGTTIFFSSHNLNEVQRYCSTVGIIKEGQLIAQKATAELTGLTTSAVSLTAENNPQQLLDALSALPVKELNRQGQEITFVYSGDINPLVAFLSQYRLSVLRIKEPTLEETFMHYYEGDKK